MNSVLNEKCKNMLENPDLEKDYHLRTTIGIYKIGHDSVRFVKCSAYYDLSY